MMVENSTLSQSKELPMRWDWPMELFLKVN